MRRAVVTTVALPNGIGPSGAPRVSLFLAPQLESDEGDRLALFPAFLDWPAVLNRAGVGYVVEVAGHGAVAASVVSAAPSSELWRALFRSGHRVDSRPEAGTGDSAFVTYPYADLGADLERRYGELGAAHVTRLPPRTALADTLGDLMDVARRGTAGRSTRDEHVRGLLRRAQERLALRLALRRDRPAEADGEPIVVGDEEPPGPRRDLAEFEAFHHPLDDPRDRQPAEPEAVADLVDFHGALAALADHPWLLRRLGLVVDLELGAAPTLSDAADPGRLRALPVGLGDVPGLRVESQWLAYVAGPSAFRTADRPGREPGEKLVDGLLAIGDGGWDLVQVDVDGGVLKAVGAAAAAAARAEAPLRADDTGGLRGFLEVALLAVGFETVGHGSTLVRSGQRVEPHERGQSWPATLRWVSRRTRSSRLRSSVFGRRERGPVFSRAIVPTAIGVRLARPRPLGPVVRLPGQP